MTFVAISKVSFPDSLREQVQSAGRAMIPIARQQPGFIGVAFHQSLDASQTMMYWEWESQSDHHACMQSEEWTTIMQDFGAVFSQENVEFSIETFEKLA